LVSLCLGGSTFSAIDLGAMKARSRLHDPYRARRRWRFIERIFEPPRHQATKNKITMRT
jgi:hypothetical protein